MTVSRALALSIGLLVLALPAQGLAGTVTRSPNVITYQADSATGSAEQVAVGIESGMAFVTSDRGAATTDCTQTDANRADCPLTPAFVVNFLGFEDTLVADAVTGPATLEARGGAGDDRLSATPNADRLFGEEGSDSIDGKGGNDLLDGGPADDTFADGAGDDTVIGGPGNDTWNAGPGRDTFGGGVGSDRVNYGDRTAGVTITLDGMADDGESGEGDNVAADIEEAIGGAGNDRIIAGAIGMLLRGGGGGDTITGSPNEDRVEGEEGDDVIDTRDGRYDSVDCGPGTDTLFADPGDFATGCEIAPDRDGDGFVNEADCQPDNAAVNPSAGEVFGNAVDEDCKNGPGYLQVVAGLSYTTKPLKRPTRVRITKLGLSSLQAGDLIEVRCAKKGCPFTLKKLTSTAGKPTLSLVALLKKRGLRKGTVVEIRILRPNQIGKVHRLTVTKTAVKLTQLCLPVGGTTPGPCPTA